MTKRRTTRSRRAPARRSPGLFARLIGGLARLTLAPIGRLLIARPVAALGILAGGGATVAIAVNALMLQPGPHPAPLFAARPPAAAVAEGAPAGSTDAIATLAGDGAPVGTADASLTSDVQQALTDLGYYDGPVDGVGGNRTAAAVRAFEIAHGLPATGVVNETLLARALTASPRKGPAEPPAKKVTTATIRTGAPAGKPAANGAAKTAAKPATGIAAKIPPANVGQGTGQSAGQVAGQGGQTRTADASAAGAAGTGSPELRRIQKALADLGYGPLTIDGLAGGQTASAIRRFRLDHGLPLSGDVDAKLVDTLVKIGGLPAG